MTANHVHGAHVEVGCRLCRLWSTKDWLRSIGICAACALGLGLWLVDRDTKQPELTMVCVLPKWRQTPCIELLRAAWADRPGAEARRAA